MPTRTAPSATPCQARWSLSASQRSLVPVKYGSKRSPVSSRTRSSCPASRSSSQIAAERRSCQTTARRGAASESRSHSTAVSRWLVMPIARRRLVAPVQCLAGSRQGGLPDLLRLVLDPARLREVLRELLVAPRRATRASSPTTSAVTPVVPASIARTLMRARRRRWTGGFVRPPRRSWSDPSRRQ